jgi:hypothetical protein
MSVTVCLHSILQMIKKVRKQPNLIDFTNLKCISAICYTTATTTLAEEPSIYLKKYI